MRKAGAVAAAIAAILIIPLLCFAAGNGFRSIPGSPCALKQYDGRRQAYFGPDKNYAGAGAFKPAEVISATALFREGDFVYVDLTYYSMSERCVYFSAGLLENVTVEYADLGSGHPATLSSAGEPRLGPGTGYSQLEQKRGNSIRQTIDVPAGSSVRALVQMNGWVFAEFDCALGKVRAWFPAEIIRCDEDIDAIRISAGDADLRPESTRTTGTCPDCGGTREQILSVSYIQYDNQYHRRGPLEADECRSCHRQFIVGADDALKEPHHFEDGICTECGYIEDSGVPCAGCGGTMIPVDEYRAVPYSDGGHTTEHYRYYVCMQCGNATDPVTEETQPEEPHQYGAEGSCLYCRYHDFGNP